MVRIASTLLALALLSGCALADKWIPGRSGSKAGEPQYERLPSRDRRIASSGGIDIFTRQSGYGPLVVVVNNGPGNSHEIMAVDLEPYEEDVRWLQYDQRGTGRSEGPSAPEGYGLAGQLEDIEALRATFEIPKLDIIGNGFGAAIAAAYAARHPDLVQRLLLLNPVVSAGQLQRAEEIRVSRITPDDRKALEELEKGGLKRSAPERYREEKVAIAQRVGTCRRDGPRPRGRSEDHKETARHVMKAMGEFDLLPELGKITAKTGIVMGRCSFLSQIGVEEIKAKVKDAQLLVLEGSGVYPYVEEKDLFRKLLRTFFGSPGGPEGHAKNQATSPSETE